MANPNLAGISGIFGKSTANTSIGTGLTTVLTTATDRVYKINTLLLSNTDTTNTALVKATIDKAGQVVTIIDNVEVPFGSAFTAIDKSIPVYLEEGDKLQVSSNTGNEVHVLISYEDIG